MGNNNCCGDDDKDKDEKEEMKQRREILNVMTWNISGINNNPWEYYVSLPDDANYNELMLKVEEYLTDKDNKITIENVLDSIKNIDVYLELESLLNNLNNEISEKEAKKLDLSHLKTIINDEVMCNYKKMRINEFLRDKTIGSQRLISWPDRLLNTIDIDNDKYIHRPTVINYYNTNIKNINHWFILWKTFMIETGLNILYKNINNKYGDLYGDNNKFLILNVIYLFLFDAVLIYLMFDIDRNWQNVKSNVYNIFNKNKLQQTANIINHKYNKCDIVLLQEVRSNFSDPIINEKYHVIFPSKKSKNNQNSVILVSKKKKLNMKLIDIEEITSLYFDAYEGGMKINCGDLLIVKIDKMKLILISFHGDTGGLATKDLLLTINEIHLKQFKNYKLLIGIDANTYFGHVNNKKQYGLNDFVSLIKDELKMNTCFNNNIPSKHTTNCPRTYLQPQLNKAVPRNHIINNKKYVDFRSAKDFIIFYHHNFNLMKNTLCIDNTGNQHYNGDFKYVIPSKQFPSDHAILSCSLQFK